MIGSLYFTESQNLLIRVVLGLVVFGAVFLIIEGARSDDVAYFSRLLGREDSVTT
jgi:hypothetical protein